VVGLGEAKPPRIFPFSALLGGVAAEEGGKKGSWRNFVPPNLSTA